MGDADDLVLPEGVRLVHIGPHKTGTTALQWSFHTQRAELAAHGVHYAGDKPQPYREVTALTGRRGRLGAPRGTLEEWRRLVDEIGAAGDQRVVMSCESLANADTGSIERLVGDLGPDRVHVVRMLRRYDKMLPSQWQQIIAGGSPQAYESWLESIFSDPSHTFWQRHGYGELTGRWADVVGPENVTVVVVDERDREANLRWFERSVGLSAQTLQLVEGHANRSFTAAEAELVRQLNQAVRTHRWPSAAHYRYVRKAVTPALKDEAPAPGEPRVTTPPWALRRAAEAADRGVREIGDLGVRVAGDLSALSPSPVPATEPFDGEDPVPTVLTISTQAAAAALGGVVEAATARPLSGLVGPPVRTGRGRVPVNRASTGYLLRLLARRTRKRLRPSTGATARRA